MIEAARFGLFGAGNPGVDCLGGCLIIGSRALSADYYTGVVNRDKPVMPKRHRGGRRNPPAGRQSGRTRGKWKSRARAKGQYDSETSLHQNVAAPVGMTLQREAIFTSQHHRHNNTLRKLPILFVRSSEVYDPSKLIYGIKRPETSASEVESETATSEKEKTLSEEDDSLFFVDTQGESSLNAGVSSEVSVSSRQINHDGIVETASEMSLDTVGIADDESSDSDDEEEDDDENQSEPSSSANHSSDMEYEQLIDLKRLALRDLDLGDSIDESREDVQEDDADSSSNNEVVEEQEIADQGIGSIVRILRTQYGQDGKEFLVEWVDNPQPSTITASELYESFEADGFTEQDIDAIIGQLGGEITDVSDLSDQDINYDVGHQMADSEVDEVIRRLIEGESASLESHGSSHATTRKTRKNKPPNFNVSDNELKEQLEKYWLKSRESKRLRKKERETARAQGLLNVKEPSEQSEVLNLRDKYPLKITVSEVVDEIRAFIEMPQTTILFPPLDQNARWIIKRLSESFYIGARTMGSGFNKFVAATKSPNTNGSCNNGTVFSLLNRRKNFMRTDVNQRPVKTESLPTRKGGSYHHKEGDIVGATAEELGQDNIGRVMLEKMGWKAGMGLGTTNVGIIEPVAAKVKRTKWGIGV
jgi:hypothetical protein